MATSAPTMGGDAGHTTSAPNKKYAGANTAATIDASDTYRVKYTTMPNDARHASASSQSTPNSTPTAVATPLPPLKRKNTGYRWPTNAASPTSAKVAWPSPSPGPHTPAAHRGNQPFTASSTSVAMAAFLLPERSTLVAPGFLLP